MSKMLKPNKNIEKGALLNFENLNVDLDINKIKNVKSPIFFIENDDDKRGAATNIPNPYDVAYKVIDEYNSLENLMGSGIFKELTPFNKADMICKRFACVLRVNFNAIIENGILSIIKPFLRCTRNELFNLIDKIYDVNLDGYKQPLYTALINKRFDTKEDSLKTMDQLRETNIKFITSFAQFYFEFISAITTNGFINMDGLCDYLVQLYNKHGDEDLYVPNNSKYMFIAGCLLELSNHDMLKITEILEINLMQTIDEYMNSVMGQKGQVNEYRKYGRFVDYDDCDE